MFNVSLMFVDSGWVLWVRAVSNEFLAWLLDSCISAVELSGNGGARWREVKSLITCNPSTFEHPLKFSGSMMMDLSLKIGVSIAPDLESIPPGSHTVWRSWLLLVRSPDKRAVTRDTSDVIPVRATGKSEEFIVGQGLKLSHLGRACSRRSAETGSESVAEACAFGTTVCAWRTDYDSIIPFGRQIRRIKISKDIIMYLIITTFAWNFHEMLPLDRARSR